MAVNTAFHTSNLHSLATERSLYQNLIKEAIQIYGHDVYYLPRTLVNKDLILGEDVASKFNAAYLCEMYMDTTEGFAGEQELVSKFGLEIREDTTFTVSKRRWEDIVGDPATQIVSDRPNAVSYTHLTLPTSDLV